MINCYFDGAYTSATSHPAYLHDYGQILRVFDLDLPAVVEAHFSLEESGKSILRMGTCEKGITHIPIPDSCLEETGSFYCYIFDRDSTSGRTVYKIKIPVLKRADMPTETTEPSEQDVAYFEQVLAQVAENADRAESAKDALLGGLTIGDVDTLESDEDATASFSESEGNILLNLGIPKGEKGEKGDDGETASTDIVWVSEDVRCGGSDQDSAEHSLSSKADKLHVTVTKIAGDNPSNPTANKTYEQIMAAVQEGAEIICTYTVQLVYGGEIEQEVTQHLQFIRADEYNIHFGFCGWGIEMGKYRLVAHAIDISAYDDITVYDNGVEIATAANITTLTSRISQLEARVTALEGGNG